MITKKIVNGYYFEWSGFLHPDHTAFLWEYIFSSQISAKDYEGTVVCDLVHGSELIAYHGYWCWNG